MIWSASSPSWQVPDPPTTGGDRVRVFLAGMAIGALCGVIAALAVWL